MPYSYHPFPIVSIIKTIILVVILFAVLIAIRDYVGSFFLPLSGLIVLIGAFKVLSALAIANSYTVTLDDSTVTFSVGILSRKEYVLPYSKITETSFTQGLLQRMLGLGNLNVDTPGADIDLHLNDVRFKDIQYTLDRIKESNK